MIFYPGLSGYSEGWAENRQYIDARDRLAALARTANIHVNFQVTKGERKGSIYSYDTELEKNLTKIFGYRMSVGNARLQPRYWQWATTYPGARSLRPDFFAQVDAATGWGVGYPLEPLARQYDSRTQQWYELGGPWLPLPAGPAYPGDQGLSGVNEDIDAKIASHKQQAESIREAINDWLWWHGINGFVMDEQELTSTVEYVNEAERGNPIMRMMIESAAPQIPDYQGSYDPPVKAPAAPFFSLQNFDIAKSWPGIAAGAAAALLL